MSCFGFIRSSGVYLQTFFSIFPKKYFLACFGPKTPQNRPFIGVFARAFQQVGWSDLVCSGFMASLGPYLQFFFEKVIFWPVGDPENCKIGQKQAIFIRVFARAFQQVGSSDLVCSGFIFIASLGLYQNLCSQILLIGETTGLLLLKSANILHSSCQK